MAIGVPHEIAHGSIRFSVGEDTTDDGVDYVLEKLPEIIERLRAMSPMYEEFEDGKIKSYTKRS
jgi:cysteine desulfurase